MRGAVAALAGRAGRRVRRDLRSDPYLRYVLLLAALLTGFWLWHLLPSFATWDEHGRLFSTMIVYGKVIADPGFESLGSGVLQGVKSYGATYYLNAIALAPVAIGAALVGDLGAFETFGANPSWAYWGFWRVWHETPAWIWTASLLAVRLINVLFALGSVYTVYRIGNALRDRTTGRLAAAFLTITFGFLTLAHEAGEDIPALFFFLVATYLALRYVQTDDRSLYLAGCAIGGVALAFKFTAAPVIVVLGVAFLLCALRAEDTASALVQPRLLLTGMGLGALAVVLGFPSVLVGGPTHLLDRLSSGVGRTSVTEHAPDAPIWWWYLRGYLNGLGLPLFFGAVGGVVASVVQFRDRETSTAGIVLCVTGVAAYLLLYATWHDIRTHHLLVTFPLLLLLLAAALSWVHDTRPGLARPLVALLLVTGGAYAVAGDVGYATQPRDQAVAWLDANAPPNATMEVYREDIQNAAIPHDMEINHAWNPPWRGTSDDLDPCPEYIQLTYRDLYYLNSDTYTNNDPQRAAYVRDLLAGEYAYELTKEFGSRPPDFAAHPTSPDSLLDRDLLTTGIVPRVPQYGDEQDMGRDQYTAILERTGSCDASRSPPF